MRQSVETDTGLWLIEMIRLKKCLGKEAGILKQLELSLVQVYTGNGKGKTTAADLVTEMKEIKHPLVKGILARQGIEY